MKKFKNFINEASEAKKCPKGQYYCFTDKKCKKIPTGYRVGYGGRLAPDPEKKKENLVLQRQSMMILTKQ